MFYLPSYSFTSLLDLFWVISNFCVLEHFRESTSSVSIYMHFCIVRSVVHRAVRGLHLPFDVKAPDASVEGRAALARPAAGAPGRLRSFEHFDVFLFVLNLEKTCLYLFVLTWFDLF